MKKILTSFIQKSKKELFFLSGLGEVGLFSDSVYAFSRDLERLLDYLIYLRESLCAHGLFFNAVVSRGDLGSFNLQSSGQELPVFGVGFTDKSIIDLYLEQTLFKGIGIKINNQLINEVNEISSLKIANSFYYTSYPYNLKPYYDIAYDVTNMSYDKKMKNILSLIIKSALKAYSVNINHGRYYTSLFFTIMDSYDSKQINWDWEQDDKTFKGLPEIFNIIINISTGRYDECKDWIGIDALCLRIIDMILCSEKVDNRILRDIISVFINFPCLKKYINSLDSIPDVFSTPVNKKKFINCVQDYFAHDLVQKLIGDTSYN